MSFSYVRGMLGQMIVLGGWSKGDKFMTVNMSSFLWRKKHSHDLDIGVFLFRKAFVPRIIKMLKLRLGY